MEKLTMASKNLVSTWDSFVNQLRQVWFIITVLGVTFVFVARTYNAMMIYPRQVDANTLRITRDSLRDELLRAQMDRMRMAHDSLAGAVTSVSDIAWKLFCYEVERDGTQAQQLECNMTPHLHKKDGDARLK